MNRRNQQQAPATLLAAMEKAGATFSYVSGSGFFVKGLDILPARLVSQFLKLDQKTLVSAVIVHKRKAEVK